MRSHSGTKTERSCQRECVCSAKSFVSSLLTSSRRLVIISPCVHASGGVPQVQFAVKHRQRAFFAHSALTLAGFGRRSRLINLLGTTNITDTMSKQNCYSLQNAAFPILAKAIFDAVRKRAE
jgi:hypothetical protein